MSQNPTQSVSEAVNKPKKQRNPFHKQKKNIKIKAETEIPPQETTISTSITMPTITETINIDTQETQLRSTVSSTVPLVKTQKNQKPKKANNKTKDNTTQEKNQHVSSAVHVSGVSCPICLEENIVFIGIGACSHGICSTCALRMRCKNHNNSCAICKAELKCILIYPAKESDKITSSTPYQLLLSGSLSMDDRIPDCQYDYNHQLIYYQAKEHFSSMQHIKSIYCPVMSAKPNRGDKNNKNNKNETVGTTQLACQGLTFRDHKQLLQHLDKYHPEEKICTLCLDARPLFLHEYELLSKKQMKLHMKGMLQTSQYATIYININ